MIDFVELGVAQLQVAGAGVFRYVRGIGCLDDRKRERRSHQESQRDLPRRRSVLLRDLLEHFALSAPQIRKIAVPEGTVRHHRDAMLLAKREHRVLDCAFTQVIEHLVADRVAILDRFRFANLLQVEIADAP